MSGEEDRRETNEREERDPEESPEEGIPEKEVEEVEGGGTDPGAGDPSDPLEEVGEPIIEGTSEALEGELESVRWERDEYLESLRRLKAEFENARKRQRKERERILQTASERLILSLLPVLDNLDRALGSEGDIREGVRATRDQLADAMASEGLLPVASDGQRFDPNVHEAVMSQPSEDDEEGTILQTFERGYLLNGKPIRAAKVVVSQ